MKQNYDNYIKIQNCDGKVWILPQTNLEIAFLLYQPSSIRGRALKKCLPWEVKIPTLGQAVKRILKIQECVLEIDSKIDKIIHCVFNQENLVYAYFSGTPTRHQKATIQVFTLDRIMGYCKVANSKEVNKLFVQEKKILDRLDKCGVTNVPKCLYCGEIDDGTGIFIQDTRKSSNSKIVQELSNQHMFFLQELSKKTGRKCKYDLSDYYLMLRRFKKNIHILVEMGYDEDVFRKSIVCVEKVLKGKSFFSVYHGDFTPWNTFEEDGHIFAFDFEYARETYPPYLDMFHFFTQSLIFRKGMTAKKIFHLFETRVITESNRQLFQNIYCSYLQYLLHIVDFFIERDQGALKEDDLRCVGIWYQIIVFLLESGKL